MRYILIGSYMLTVKGPISLIWRHNELQVARTMKKYQSCSLLLVVLYFFFCYSQNKDFLETVLTRVAFNKLEGKSIKVIFVNSILKCALRCQRFPECLSLNVADQPNKDGLYKCVFFRNKTSRSNGLLKPSKFYHHYTLFEVRLFLIYVFSMSNLWKRWICDLLSLRTKGSHTPRTSVLLIDTLKQPLGWPKPLHG